MKVYCFMYKVHPCLTVHRVQASDTAYLVSILSILYLHITYSHISKILLEKKSISTSHSWPVPFRFSSIFFSHPRCTKMHRCLQAKLAFSDAQLQHHLNWCIVVQVSGLNPRWERMGSICHTLPWYNSYCCESCLTIN